jgi:hypothetical protein
MSRERMMTGVRMGLGNVSKRTSSDAPRWIAALDRAYAAARGTASITRKNQWPRPMRARPFV